MKKSYVTVTDQFCGAGGSSIGVISAGAEVRQAMNHWKRAIETYATNHPDTDVDCTDISACDPRRYRATDILITSPECTNHSLAKGRQRKLQAQLELFGQAQVDPAEERSRATMWDVPRFAEVHNYNAIIVENVVDARNWRLFDAWLHAMRLLDYDFEIVYLNSMFAHPTPQSRDRMYVVFWKRGNRAPSLAFTPPAYCPGCGRNVEAVQSWKNPAKRWGRYGRNRQYVYRCPACASEVEPYYYCAANAIDWSLPAERIGDRTRPLKEKTLNRIKVGLEKYGRQPVLIGIYGPQGQRRTVPLANSIPTLTATPTFGLVVQTQYGEEARGDLARDITQPLPTQTTRHSLGLVVDLAYTHGHDGRSYPIDHPWPTQTGQQTLAFIVSMRDAPDYPLHAVTDPLPTQSTIGAPYLVELYGQSEAASITDPIGCQLSSIHHGVVMPYLVELHGTSEARAVTDALGCVLAGGNHHGLVMPIVTSVNYFDDITGPVTEPMPTQTTGAKVGLTIPPAFIASYYGNDQVKPVTEALGTVTTLDRHALIETGELPRVEDCYFRMLKSHEIGRAMAFPGTYVVTGNERDKVKQYGNAVTPPAMRMIFERCLETLQ